MEDPTDDLTAEFLSFDRPPEPGEPELFSTVAWSVQMLSDDMPFGKTSAMVRLADAPDALYEGTAEYRPEIKDGESTGRRFLEMKLRRIG